MENTRKCHESTIKANPIEKLVFNDEELTDSIKTAGACNQHFASVGKNLAAQIEI